MKKITIVLSAIILTTLISSGLVLATQVYFSDVSPTDWFYNDVSNLADLEVVSGYSDGTFKPSEGVNRAEISAILNRYDQGKIADLKNELTILRSERTQDLSLIKNWSTFKNKVGDYPANNTITPSYNKMGFDWTIFDYDKMDDFVVVATDNTGARKGGNINEIVVHKSILNDNIWKIYNVRMSFSAGSFMYGPFYGNFDDIVDDINGNYYDDSKSTDPESLKY